MSAPDEVLQVRDLSVRFRQDGRTVEAVKGEPPVPALKGRCDDCPYRSCAYNGLAQDQLPQPERARDMNQVNPAYVLRNHLAEIAIRQAAREGDHSGIERLQRCLSAPFEERDEFQDLASAPPGWAGELSVSCSS